MLKVLGLYELKHNLNVFVRAPVLRKETYLKTPPGGQTDT